MSLFGRIKKFAKKALRKVVLPLAGAGALGPVAGGIAQPFLPAVVPAAGAAAARALPGIAGPVAAGARRVLPGIGAGVAAGLGIQAISGVPMKKRRRMNPANVKALNRAVRRVNASLNLLKRVEKMQKRVHPPRRARAPAGHRARLVHST